MSVSADVTRRIRDLIAESGLVRGDRLPSERELAVLLGLSRPALREGLRRLVDAGVLVPRRGAGTFIAGADPEQLLEVRDRLEPHAARLAASAHTAIDAAALRRIVDDLRAGVAPAYVELRLAIAAASGNQVLAAAIIALTELEPAPAKVGTKVVRDMARVADRIVARDSAGAAKAMRRHLQRLGR